MGNKFYTPDGFCDTLPNVCAYKKDAEGRIRTLFAHHGFIEIETPGVEYCDIYTKPDFVPEEELYKFTDHKGRLLCARYDGTVPAARFAATVYKNEALPLRLSYIENMYRFNQSGGGKQSEFTQAGVELMGAKGSDSDAEVLALAIRTILETGIEDLQISIGQVKLFEGIINQLGISEEDAEIIRHGIDSKDSVSIEKVANRIGLSAQDKETLLMLPEGQGTYDIIEAFRSRVTDSKAIEALDNMQEILDVMDEYGYLKYVSVDPGLLGGTDYYTGVIFKGYTYEVGFPIVSGGRYDNAVGVFGRDMECVGFSMSLSLAITALMRQGKISEKAPIDVIIGYDSSIKGARANAIAMADQLRDEGSSVILDTTGMTEDELDAYADANDIAASFYVIGEVEE